MVNSLVVTQTDRQKYVEAIKGALLTIAKKNLLAYLISLMPFLAWGPIAPFVSMLVEHLLSKALEGGETLIFFQFVDFRVATQSKDFTEAALRNYEAQQHGTQEEKDEAEKKLIEAHDTFVKLNSI